MKREWWNRPPREMDAMRTCTMFLGKPRDTIHKLLRSCNHPDLVPGDVVQMVPVWGSHEISVPLFQV